MRSNPFYFEIMLLFEQEIPVYLQSSPFLQGLLSEGPFPESGIEIPDRCLKKNTEVVTYSDLIDLFHTLRFWLLPELLVCFRFSEQGEILC